MRLLRGSLTNLVRQGRITLQIPEIEVNISENPNQELSEENPFPFVLTACTNDEYVEYPDEWFMYVKYDSSSLRPCVGKESGFLYFTRVGYEVNKEEIREAFEAACDRGHGNSFSTFEVYVEDFFSKMEKRIERTINRERGKLDELEEQLAIVKG